MTDTKIEIPVQFRLCREDDLEALEWMGLHTREREIIAGAFAAQQSGGGLMLLATAGGYPVAQAWLDFSERGSEARPLLWAVRVFPALQGAGLGEKLMSRAEALAAERGARELDIGVELDNAAAHRFYRRLGFRPVGFRRDVERYSFEEYPIEVTLDQQIMRKQLAGSNAAPNSATEGGGDRAGRGRDAGRALGRRSGRA